MTKKILDKYFQFKFLIFGIRIIILIISFIYLIYIFYINFLPFGYNKEFIINVGSKDDTTVSEFYLLPNNDLSDSKIDINNQSYRKLNGSVLARIRPKVNLKLANVKVIVDGKNVGIIPPTINFEPNMITEWDYVWDFSKKIPEGFVGDAFLFEGGTHFSNSRLEFKDTTNDFENQAFSVYIKWKPTNNQNNNQQIIGHFNWELWQNKESVTFRVGKMNNSQGSVFLINYPITEDFFNKKHTALAIYNPEENGYIELYVDNTFVDRKYFGTDKIWTEYGNQNLSLGWTPHFYGKSQYYAGTIFQVNIISKNILQFQPEANFEITSDTMPDIQIVSTYNNALIKQIKLNVRKK